MNPIDRILATADRRRADSLALAVPKITATQPDNRSVIGAAIKLGGELGIIAGIALVALADARSGDPLRAADGELFLADPDWLDWLANNGIDPSYFRRLARETIGERHVSN